MLDDITAYRVHNTDCIWEIWAIFWCIGWESKCGIYVYYCGAYKFGQFWLMCGYA